MLRAAAAAAAFVITRLRPRERGIGERERRFSDAHFTNAWLERLSHGPALSSNHGFATGKFPPPPNGQIHPFVKSSADCCCARLCQLMMMPLSSSSLSSTNNSLAFNTSKANLPPRLYHCRRNVPHTHARRYACFCCLPTAA